MTKPREDFLSCDEVFMGIAALISKRSKDPSTQVGSVIVGTDNTIKATGYNGFPRNISNDKFPWDRDGSFLDTKYAYMCHAEANAIDNRGANTLNGARIYVTLFPCNECSKRIIQNGITEIIYLEDKYAHKDYHKASVKLLDASGIKYRQYIPKDILLEFKNGQ